MSLDKNIGDWLEIVLDAAESMTDWLDIVDTIDTITDNNYTNQKKTSSFDKILIPLKSAFNDSAKKVDSFIESKGRTEQKELYLFEIRDNILLIVLLVFALILTWLVATQAPAMTQEYEKTVKQITSLKKETLTFQKKTQWNNWYKDFSDLLQYGVKSGDNYYPAGGYLSELSKLYPTKEGLNFGTFTEWWTSDFVTWRWEKIRIPKDILKEYKVLWEQELDSNYKKISYSLKLEWSQEDIDKYLSTLNGLKLVKNLFEIKEHQKDNNITSDDIKISFYLKK